MKSHLVVSLSGCLLFLEISWTSQNNVVCWLTSIEMLCHVSLKFLRWCSRHLTGIKLYGIQSLMLTLLLIAWLRSKVYRTFKICSCITLANLRKMLLQWWTSRFNSLVNWVQSFSMEIYFLQENIYSVSWLLTWPAQTRTFYIIGILATRRGSNNRHRHRIIKTFSVYLRDIRVQSFMLLSNADESLLDNQEH